MKNKNYGITFGTFALFVGGLIFNFLWYIMAFILVWGLAKFISKYFPFVKSIGKFLKLDKLDTIFSSILSFSYKHFPDPLYYTFLLRVPIISGLILVFFPFIAQFTPAQNFFQNIFVMENGIQLLLVMICTTLTAIIIVSFLETVLILTDKNFDENKSLQWKTLLGTILLILPTTSILIFNREQNIESFYLFLSWGIEISIGLLILDGIIEDGLNIPKPVTDVIGGLQIGDKLSNISKPVTDVIDGLQIGDKLSNISKPVTDVIDGLQIGDKLSNISKPVTNTIADLKSDVKKRRIIFFLVEVFIGLFFYVLVIFFNWPRNQNDSILPNNLQAPTLLYVLLMIWILTLFIGLVTFLFDKSVDNQLDNQKKSLGTKASEIGEKEKEKFLAKFLNQFQEKFKLLNHTFYWPVILFLIIFSGLGYGVWGVDHFFKLEDSHVVITNYQQDFQQATWNRLCEDKFNVDNKTQTCDNNEPKSLVVVGASGGGIQASGWMTQVLAGLQDQKLGGIGEDFTKAIGLISSTSGGSVGSMFYLNQFEKGVLSKGEDGHIKQGKNRLLVVENSTDDWLNSVGWGLAFPDVFRAIGLPWVLQPFRELGGDQKPYLYLDRGYALEKNWQKTLGGKKPPTLDDRREQILKGEIPIAVYNTTLVENGRPFYVSSMKFVEGTMANYASESSGKNVDNTALDFKTLYNNCGTNGDQPCDLALTTAARLSASFPYVTPMARNDRENIIKVKDDKGNTLTIKVKDGKGNDTDFLQNYHIADGGYYDNSGAFTAMNWLNDFLEYNNSNKDHRINIAKVLILQINAFPEDDLKLNQQGSLGFVVSTIGPLNTLAGIRDATQIGRNKIFANLLKDRWGNIEIKNFTISFPKKDTNGKDYNPPLSWRLTERQKMNLVDAWEKDTDIRETVECMKDFWKNGKMTLPQCQKSDPSAS
jgi:hypothetical protein